MADPQQIIAALGLEPHPEGGWYRQTWREAGPEAARERGTDDHDANRGLATAIYFLLEGGKRSHWHRVDGTELWLFHAGSAVELLIAPGDDGPVETIRVGSDVLAGDRPQAIVPHGWWQATEAREGWALVSCVVAPGFVFEGFELAPPGWAPKS